MPGIHIRMFGSLTAEREDVPLTRFPSRKVGDLFAYIVLHRETPQPREGVAAALWPDFDTDRARHCLNTAIWRLRAVLGEPSGDVSCLRIDNQGVGLNASSNVVIDVVQFERLLTLAAHLPSDQVATKASLCEEAVSLYRGDLLLDCYDDWCVVERERLLCQYLDTLGWLMSFYTRSAQFELAVTMGQRLLARDPLRESVHRQLMELYLRLERPAAALRQYETCREIVRRELGGDVTTETRALLARITAASGVQQAAPPQVDLSQVAVSEALDRLRRAMDLHERARQELEDAISLVQHARSQPATPSSTVGPTVPPAARSRSVLSAAVARSALAT